MGADAFDIYKYASAGYCCSQIMMLLYLKDNNIENVPLVKSMEGLCGGIGGTGKTCGILSAGACLLSLYAGKGHDTDMKDDNLKKMIKEYSDWFNEEFEGTDCVDIVTIDTLKDINENAAYPIKCGNMIQKGYKKVNEILREHEYI